MRIGVEEEFFLLDPSTLFLCPAAPRIGLSLVLKERKFINNFSMEFPHSPSALRYPFSIAEIKTSPKKDIDSLKSELVHNREMLRDVCRDSGLKVLASGSHPFCNPSIHGKANCCAFHIHVSEVNLKQVYRTLRLFTGPLITLSANSPFLGGKKAYFCSRLTYSPFVGTRDFFINKSFNTIETRIFDTQITSKRAISLTSLIAVLATASTNLKFDGTEAEQIIREREHAIRYGFSTSDAKKKLEGAFEFGESLGLNDQLNSLFNQDSGSLWQLRTVEKFGFCSLLYSLFESFEKDKLCTTKGEEERIFWNDMSIKKIPREIPSILGYTPFILYNKLKTYHQKLPYEIVRWIKEVFRELA
jgi:gamma-glutamyl:cysteine ligase YbdK (ATP-grasp superfamily)